MDKLQKSKPVSLATVAERYTAQNSIVLRASGDLKEVLKANEPDKIEVGLEAPKLNFLKNAWGVEKVTAAMSVFATDTASALGFNIEGKERVIGLLVRDLMDKQPYYSLEDFMYYFKLMRRKEIGGKSFGKEDWQIFQEGLKQFDEIRADTINQENRDLKKKAYEPEIPKEVVEVIASVIPKEVIEDVNKEAEYKKAKIAFLKNRLKKGGKNETV